MTSLVIACQAPCQDPAWIFKKIFGHATWHSGSYFPDQGSAHAPCSESAESQPLDGQGSSSGLDV